jgi:ketosteroid isomerase-like protein
MRSIAFLALVLTLLVITADAQKTKADPSKDIRAVFDTLIEGIRQSDVEKVMSVYHKSDRTLFFNNNGSATIGWETMRANRERLYSKTTNVTLETTGVRVEVLSPTSAYVSCKWKQTQDFEGKPESASGRMTLVFKKVGKDWKVVHLHTSPDLPDPARPVLPSERALPAGDSAIVPARYTEPGSLTLEKYNRIKRKMSYGEVVRSYKWDGGEFRFIFATFFNDRLNSKSQSNLK